uniref:Uncharacterized protein n=1 Tax=viral metagenome TaxID=1070528 RepID=A0A6C0AFQ8_9ZZZZ
MLDFIGVSLGFTCVSAVFGVNKKIRSTKKDGYNTCVFDTMISNYEGIIDCINNDFEGFCDPNNLELININTDYAIYPHWEQPLNEQWVYNKKYKFLFNHESPGHANLYLTQQWESIDYYIKNNFENFIIKYNKRINNFRNYINSGKFIIFIINKYDNNVYELERTLFLKYPKLNFKIITVICNIRDTEIFHRNILRMMKFENNEIENIFTKRATICNNEYNSDKNNKFSKNEELLLYYKNSVLTKSHINQHLNVVKYYSEKCSSVLELGLTVYTIGITASVILGMEQNNYPNNLFTGIFEISLGQELQYLKNITNINMNILKEREINIKVEDLQNHDMLIINSWFTYKHVKYNLENFGKIINNYIIICATTIHEHEDHPLYISGEYTPVRDFSEYPYDNKKGLGEAIKEFLEDHTEWVLYERHYNNYGMTILKKMQ